MNELILKVLVVYVVIKDSKLLACQLLIIVCVRVCDFFLRFTVALEDQIFGKYVPETRVMVFI